ncbi:putative mitochondrial respiratory complex I chaperone [Talaromyces proteolyticus]|uniref:Mitochondrial respiratory complex I chaperone n=1 Tax=Talaromyces proteolyticus TaxID=1131652 RepID=A0AAD4L487_9EURO|nr:putative mitochondrial respiratory complex I chaperone [Talaromyces proteolyticus]KAH8704731.1 putative mitochondrial respiratory complex I chaperone [Talaromyces proteolyticus]
MQSHLTRRVFRAILNNEPVCFSPRRSRIYSPSSILHTGQIYNRHVQSRGFFAFPTPSRTETANVPASEIGLQAMSELVKSLSTRRRPPPFDVLCKSYQDFLEARAEEPGVITDFHAKRLVDTYEYIKSNQQEQDGKEWQIFRSAEISETVLYVLSRAICHPDSHDHVRTMAHNAYDCLVASSEQNSTEISYGALLAYIKILANCSNPVYAERVAMRSWPMLKASADLSLHELPWICIIRGLALKRDRVRVDNFVNTLSAEYDYIFTPLDQEELVKELIEQNDVHAAKIIYECPLPLQEKPTQATEIAVSKASILSGDVAFAGKLLKKYASSPSTETRDVLLLMEAAKGNGAPALTKKLDDWSSKNPSILHGLSVSCVNDLVQYANFIGNSQLAVEYSELITKWNLKSDGDSLLLLKLESCVKSSDIKGTLSILSSLEEGDASTNISLSMRYRLIKLLCQYPHDDAAYDQISKLLDPLIQDNTQIEPETLAALTGILASRNEWDALSQLLRPRLSSYALINERPIIRSALLNFIHNKEQDDENIWRAYQLLRIAFPETEAESRIAIMNVFFERKMIDKACEVFGHMRHASSRNQHPTVDAYVSCFLGLSRVADWENVKLIRNMLRLDVDVEPSTRLQNAVMLALAACEKPDDAMDVFREILRSDDGPTHTTLAIFFKVCQSLPNGVAEAAKMMQKITMLEIPLDRSLYLAYIKALAAQGEQDTVTQALDALHSKIGQSPDADMIAQIYNVCPHEIAKDVIEEWTKAKFPTVWSQLDSAQRTEREEGMYFEGFEEVLEL